MRVAVDGFRPPPGLRSRHTQSLLSSSPLRRWIVQRRAAALRAAERAWVLDGGDGVRLEGFHSAQPGGDSRGLVVLLHGWEGSVNSNYILANGARLGWLIDPEGRRVYIYRPGQAVERLDNPDTLAGDPVLPGFVLDPRTLW